MTDRLSWLEQASVEDASKTTASIDAPKETENDPASVETLDLEKGQGESSVEANTELKVTTDNLGLDVPSQTDEKQPEVVSDPDNAVAPKSDSETQGASLESNDANEALAGDVDTIPAKAEGEVELKPDEASAIDAANTDVKPEGEIVVKASTEDATEGEEPAAADTPAEDDAAPVEEEPAATEPEVATDAAPAAGEEPVVEAPAVEPVVEASAVVEADAAVDGVADPVQAEGGEAAGVV